MPFKKTGLPGLLLFEPRVFEDDRGYFYESFNAQKFRDVGIQRPFVQDNQAFSEYGVVRGLHYQTGVHAQAKLVRCIEGEVLDVVVDLRPGSPTRGKTYQVVLSGDNKLQMYVPRGFAHGYSVLSKRALFFYKCDNFYNKESEGGIALDDPGLQIDWRIDREQAIISEKDRILPKYGNHRPV